MKVNLIHMPWSLLFTLRVLRFIGILIKERRVNMEWIKISEKYPPAHDLYVVSRDDHEYLATPCYGMHHPWWVVKVMDGDAEPVPMKDDDYWRER